ncbi:MAG: TonB-dependent receptor [Burkholderiales bacterium]|nr:TonB-dependent receptor [Burkholderiales bacterium]
MWLHSLPEFSRLPIRRLSGALAGLFLPACAVLAQESSSGKIAEVPQTVEIAVKQSATQMRQNDTGLRSIYGQEELQKYGDISVAEVLQRLPGVSVSDNKGKGVEIRLRGLGNGYTQVLLNGSPVPAGFSIDTLAPDVIERIEIIRSASAELSAQGIAGTVNIVLKKKPERNQPTEVKLGISQQAGLWSPHLTVNTSGKTKEISYALSATADMSRTDTHSDADDYLLQAGAMPGYGGWSSVRHWQREARRKNDTISIAPRLNWAPDEQQTVQWQGFASAAYQAQRKQEQETTLIGASSDFPQNQSVWNSHVYVMRNDLNWETRLDNNARFRLTAGWDYLQRNSNFQFWGEDRDAVLLEHRFVVNNIDQNEMKLNGSYQISSFDNHVIKLGWDSSRAWRNEIRNELDTHVTSGSHSADMHNYDSTIDRLAGFVQDEWSLRTDLSAYLGLRWESLRLRSNEIGAYQIDHRFQILSPIMQTVWKLTEQQQIRMALNRSFKVPRLQQLIPRLFRVDNNNNPLKPDFQFNPELRPETAWGLDLAYEHYLSHDGLLSASAYVRKIHDLHHEVLSQHDGIWLSQPINDGNAIAMGIELEARLDLRSLSAAALPIRLRGSLGRHWSRIDRVPGPDNRLSDQSALSASLGADYVWSNTLTVGGDLNFQRGATVRDSAYLYSTASAKRNLDIYAVWRYSNLSQWRLSANNVLHQQSSGADQYQDARQEQISIYREPSDTTWRLTWEQRF